VRSPPLRGVVEPVLNQPDDLLGVNRHTTLTRISGRRPYSINMLRRRSASNRGACLHDGESVRGVYRRSIDLASGRFAMLDDGIGFSLVPWRPVMEEHLGRELRGMAIGVDISWDFSRTRGIGR
jgi:hypothetical protein